MGAGLSYFCENLREFLAFGCSRFDVMELLIKLLVRDKITRNFGTNKFSPCR